MEFKFKFKVVSKSELIAMHPEYDYEWERGWLRNIPKVEHPDIMTSEMKLDKVTLKKIKDKFQKNQNDKNSYLAYLFSNIFAGNEYKSILEIGIKKGWDNFFDDYYEKAIFHLLADHFESELNDFKPVLIIKPNGKVNILKKRLADGVISIINNPAIHYQGATSTDWFCCCEVLYKELLVLKDKDKVVLPKLIEKFIGKNYLLNEEIYTNEGYIETLILADYYFSRGKLLDALKLYIRLDVFNKYYEIDEREFQEIIKTENEKYDNFIQSITPLSERIELCIDDILTKYENRIDSLIFNAYREVMILNQEKIEKNYMIKIYKDMESIFENIIMGNYEDAMGKLKNFEKYNQKKFNVKCENFINDLRKGKKTFTEEMVKDFTMPKVNMNNVQGYHIIAQIEKNLREFIRENLKSYYGEKWWRMGVPDKIRKDVAIKKEEDPEGENKDKIEYLDFKDYHKIITMQKNWNNIFKQYFVIGKVKNKEKLTSWVSKIIPIRIEVMHSRDIDKNQLKQLREYYRTFTNIYNEWKKKGKHWENYSR